MCVFVRACVCVCVCVRVHVHVSVCMRARVHVSVRTSVLEPWVVMCEARQATTRQEREVSHMAGMRGSGLSSLFPQERERGRERGRHTNTSYALNRPDSFTAPRNPLTPSSVDP